MRDVQQSLSVGVRGKTEAMAAVEGGTHIVMSNIRRRPWVRRIRSTSWRCGR